METIHTDIYDMIVEMKTHAAQNGKAIISNDRPKELKLGYECQNTGKVWLISLRNIKKSLDNQTHSEFEVNMLRKAFASQEGKQVLLNVINGV
jgi:hypothetical protein